MSSESLNDLYKCTRGQQGTIYTHGHKGTMFFAEVEGGKTTIHVTDLISSSVEF